MKITRDIAFLMAVVMLSGCAKERFHIAGNISDADGKELYLENIGLDGITVIDSTKLGEDGAFNFSCDGVASPEFYRLRIDKRIINISIDSTETVEITASYPTMASGYAVEGSHNCSVIKELVLKQMALEAQVIAVNKNYSLTAAEARDSIARMIEAYKSDITMNYIYKAPMEASSYFALFQTLGNVLIFNPRENRDDIKAFAAVATSWDTYHPGSTRGENLHNIALQEMKNIRIVDNKRNATIDASKINVSNIIDISLPDNKGTTRKLSELTGKVVMLDFHLFSSDDSRARIMQIRELYNKYHGRGFEIYQVSLDANEHFWKQQTEALPWVSVRDADGLGSQYLQLYNVQGIPTFFLIDRTNTPWKRDAQIDDLDAEIEKLL